MAEAPKTKLEALNDPVEASKTTAKRARGEALKLIGGGLKKLTPVAIGLIGLSLVGSALWGTSWGLPALMVAVPHGLPIFGRMLSAQFAMENFEWDDFWSALSRHYSKERIDSGKWIMEGKVEIKAKPDQATGTAPGAPQA